jgi:predicted ATPase
MIITLSGSQGQGKSTVLQSLADRGYTVVEKKTSRSILKEWGYTLNEVNKYPPLTKNFQEEIIERHFATMIPHINSDVPVFMERSFADIFTYALFALGSYNEYDEWLDSYYKRCQDYQSCYAMVVHISGRTYVPDDDGVRSINRYFSRAVDSTMIEILTQMHETSGRLVRLVEPSNEVRVTKIINELSSVQGVSCGNLLFHV